MEESKAFVLKSLMKSKLWASAFNNFYTFLTTNNYLPTSLLRLLFGFIMVSKRNSDDITLHFKLFKSLDNGYRSVYVLTVSLIFQLMF